MSESISQKQHEEVATTCLVNFLETRSEDIVVGKLLPEDRCGKLAKIVDNVIWCYFDDRRNDVSIDHPSSLWTNAQLLSFIDEIVLEKINSDRPEILNKNWQGNWKMGGCLDQETGEDYDPFEDEDPFEDDLGSGGIYFPE